MSLRFYVCTKKSLAYDGQSQRHHCSSHVYRLRILPGGRYPRSACYHRIGVRLQVSVIEYRLNDAPLLSMQVALTCQQPISQSFLEATDPASLLQFCVVGDQHLFDQIRFIEKVNLLSPNMENENRFAS